MLPLTSPVRSPFISACTAAMCSLSSSRICLCTASRSLRSPALGFSTLKLLIYDRQRTHAEICRQTGRKRRNRHRNVGDSLSFGYLRQTMYVYFAETRFCPSASMVIFPLLYRLPIDVCQAISMPEVSSFVSVSVRVLRCLGRVSYVSQRTARVLRHVHMSFIKGHRFMKMASENDTWLPVLSLSSWLLLP